MTTTKLLPLGIHFGLDEDTYHADPGLGSSSLKAIAQNPVDFQFDKLNPEERKESRALLWGSAFHARVLEGFDAYTRKYHVAPSKEEFPDALVTMDDLRAWLVDKEVKPSGKRKEDLIRQVQAIDPEVEIWDDIIAFAENRAINAKATLIERKIDKEVELAVTWMQQNKILAPIMDDGAFVRGAPEVSIIYEDNGVRLKARFDYLYPGLVVDLKSYRPWTSRQDSKNIMKAIRDMRYDLQAAAYQRAYAAARDMFGAGTLAVHGNPPSEEFVKALFVPESVQWIWVMVKASGAPISTAVEFRNDLLVFEASAREIDNAIHTYRTLSEKFGADKPWMPESEVYVLSDEDFPPSWGLYA